MGNTAKIIEDHQNLMQSTSGTIASMGLQKIGQKVAGVLLTPAVWVLNYSAKGSTPDSIDIGLFVAGFAGVATSFATIGTGLVKAVVDDEINQKLKQVVGDENPKYHDFIKPCYRYGMSPAQINAMTIASKGGTAWQHQNGLWVYITDINNRPVMDFKPKSAVQTYQPKQPLIRNNQGLFKWHTVR